MLSNYHSIANFRSKEVRGKIFSHQVNYIYCYHFQNWNLYGYLKELNGLPSQGQGDG
jgi:hypothetical protein